jgi:prepilin-type N-terminal cleavage/methylation domain-containing protein
MVAWRRHGFSLAELLIVCAVLGVVAVVALPAAQPVAEFRLDAAAGEVVQALRFARQEAMRTGAYRALRCDTPNNQVQVYIPDAVGGVAATVPHPLSKMDYTINLGQAPAGGNIKLASCSFAYTGDGSTLFVAFDGNGNPVGGNTKVVALTSGSVVVGAGAATRTVTVDLAGRVTTS